MRKEIVVLIGVAIVVSLVIAGYTGLFRVKYTPDTETGEVYWENVMGANLHLTGNNFDNVDKNEDELLDQSKYITSWWADGDSEDIFLSARTYGNAFYLGFNAQIHKYWVEVYLDSQGDWNNPDYTSTPDSPQSDKIIWATPDGDNPGEIVLETQIDGSDGFNVPLTVPKFCIRGPYVGYIKVKLTVRYRWFYLWGSEAGHVYLTIEDEASLLSGEGNVEVVYPDGYDEAQPRETITFNVYTGFSGPTVGEKDKGWLLSLYYPANYPDHEGELLQSWSIPDDRHPYKVYWTVPDGIWKPNIEPFTVVLKNQLINQDEKWVIVVDVREKMPPPPKIVTEKDWSYINKPVNVTLIATPNEMTNLPIGKIYYAVWYGQQEEGNYIIPPWRSVTPIENNGQYIVKFTFVATYEDTVQIASYCTDTEGRQSNIAYRGITIVGTGPSYMTLAPSQQLVYHVVKDVQCLSTNEPDLLVAKFVDSSGKIVYVDNFKPSVVQKTGSDGLYDYYHVEGTIKFTVPAFAKTGKWTAIIYIVDKDAWLSLDDYISTVTVKFKVVDGTLAQDLLAPLYFYREFGWFIFKREISWKLPPPIVWILIGVTVSILIAFAYIRREQIFRKLKELKRR